MAILLQEEDIYQRSRLYATDMSEEAVRQARAGIFRASAVDEFTDNYQKAGGKRSLSEYFKRKGRRLFAESSLKKNIVFSQHNLATDGSFNEFQVIFCRNILGTFNHRLRDRVDRLVYDSLSRFGVLALGASESLGAMPYGESYAILDEGSRLYQKHGSGLIPTIVGLEKKDESTVEW